tara:strand:- start:13038 stop:14051 length:1014 start_codon:yes stop_codon:yes gene_type:complete
LTPETEYRLTVRSVDGDGNVFVTELTDIVTVAAPDVLLTNLEPETDYGFATQSIDRSGNGPTTSHVFSFRTNDTADEMHPAVPAGLAVRTAEGEVILSWSLVDEGDISGYDILRSKGESDFQPIATLVPGPTYRDDGLDPDVAYRYAVQAIDGASNSSERSESIEAVADGSGRPTAPVPMMPMGEEPLLQVGNAVSTIDLTYNFQVAANSAFTDIVAQASGIPAGTGGSEGITGWRVDVALEEDKTFFWRAWAFDGILDGAFSVIGEFVAGQTATAFPGDIDGDLEVGFTDFLAFANAFGSVAGDERYLAVLDLTSDGEIGFTDFPQFAMLFGTVYS